MDCAMCWKEITAEDSVEVKVRENVFVRVCRICDETGRSWLNGALVKLFSDDG